MLEINLDSLGDTTSTQNNAPSLAKKEFILSKKISTVDKYNFYEYIAVMLDGGIGISEALQSVSSKISSPYFKQKIDELMTYIASGDSFSKSMKKAPDIFPSSEVSVIEAGETTGQLSNALLKLSDDLKKIHDLKNKVKGALTYPLIIVFVLIIAVTVVMVFVIPQIKPLFEGSDVQLPITTTALLATSDFLINNYSFLIIFFLILGGGFIIYANTKSGKFRLERMLLDAPLIGKVYRNYVLANIASTLGNLVGSGVAIIKSLKLTGASSNSMIYDALLEEVAHRVGKGEGIVNSMHKVDETGEYFPADYLQMLSVGEKTASLEEISTKLSRQYTKEVDYSLANLTKWIEPMAILLAGIFVTWFALAIFGAIMQITQTVGT